jgi:hypothetical protein
MKKLIPFLLLPFFLLAQDVTRTWDDTTLIVENVVVNGLISGVAELEFETVAQMKAFDFSTVANGARVKCNGYNVANDGFFGPDVFWNAASTATDDGLSVFDPVASGAGRLVRSFTGPINVRWAGASGNYQTNATGDISSSDNTLTADASTFVSTDVGKYIEVEGAGAAGGTLVTTIASFTSDTEVELTNAASTTVSNNIIVWGTDDYAIIQSCLDTGKHVIMDIGRFLISTTITLDFEGQYILGQGGNATSGNNTITELIGSHTTGSVVRHKKRTTGIRGLYVNSTTARKNSKPANEDGHGILWEQNDGATSSISRGELTDIYIINQPTDGFHCAGGAELSVLDRVTVQDCARHGFFYDDGTAQGRSDTTLAGFIVRLNRCRAIENGGQGFVAVNTTQNYILDQYEALGNTWDEHKGYGTKTTMTGTISSTGTAVTGVGTAFTSEVAAGQFLFVGNYNYGKISSVTDNTNLVLVSAFSEGNVSSTAFARKAPFVYQVVTTVQNFIMLNPDIEDQQYGNSTTSAGNPRTALATPNKGIWIGSQNFTILNPFLSSMVESIKVASTSDAGTINYPRIFTGTYGVAQAAAIIIENGATGIEVRATTQPGATKIVQNQDKANTYWIDGVQYYGDIYTTYDIADPFEASTSIEIGSGVLDAPYTKVLLRGEGNTTDTLSQIRYASGGSIGLKGARMVLVYDGSGYNITIREDTGGSENIKNDTGANKTMNATTNTVLEYVFNGTDWIEL